MAESRFWVSFTVNEHDIAVTMSHATAKMYAVLILLGACILVAAVVKLIIDVL